jgi:hypothetical protein
MERHEAIPPTLAAEDIPIGIVGLNSVDRTFKTAMFEDDRRHWTERSRREADREQRSAQPG